MTPEAQLANLNTGVAQRPALRGVLHLGTAVAATAGAAWLLLLASSPTGYVGAAVFGTSLILLYWTSAGYHRITWGPIMRRVLKRLDHAMIFVLIAGTYTPFAFQLSQAWWVPMLSVIWGFAGAGALMRAVWLDAPRWLIVTLYVALGWIGVVAVTEVVVVFPVSFITLLGVGGAFYTLGGIVYALRRPDPWPRVFGYHEIFHSMVVAGSAFHFAIVAGYVL